MVAKHGKRADILTGSMLPVGATTGSWLGDTDLLVAMHTTEKMGKVL